MEKTQTYLKWSGAVAALAAKPTIVESGGVARASTKIQGVPTLLGLCSRDTATVSETSLSAPFERAGLDVRFDAEKGEFIVKLYSEDDIEKFHKVANAFMAATGVGEIDYRWDEGATDGCVTVGLKLVELPDTGPGEQNDAKTNTKFKEAADSKYVATVDVRMPEDPALGRRSGAVVPKGTVFYKKANGYAPWFAKEYVLTGLSDEQLQPEGVATEGRRALNADRATWCTAPALRAAGFSKAEAEQLASQLGGVPQKGADGKYAVVREAHDIEFWVVTRPTEDSTLIDILFKSSVREMQNQYLGGLKAEEILGVFPNSQSAMAVQTAEDALNGMTEPMGEAEYRPTGKPKYTFQTAGMTLSSAQAVMAAPDDYDADQKARASAVVNHWKQVRARQAQKKKGEAAGTAYRVWFKSGGYTVYQDVKDEAEARARAAKDHPAEEIKRVDPYSKKEAAGDKAVDYGRMMFVSRYSGEASVGDSRSVYLDDGSELVVTIEPDLDSETPEAVGLVLTLVPEEEEGEEPPREQVLDSLWDIDTLDVEYLNSIVTDLLSNAGYADSNAAKTEASAVVTGALKRGKKYVVYNHNPFDNEHAFLVGHFAALDGEDAEALKARVAKDQGGSGKNLYVLDGLPVSEAAHPVYTDFEEWQAAVRAAHPELRLSFMSRTENGEVVFSAEVRGQDRSYGEFNMESETGYLFKDLEERAADKEYFTDFTAWRFAARIKDADVFNQDNVVVASIADDSPTGGTTAGEWDPVKNSGWLFKERTAPKAEATDHVTRYTDFGQWRAAAKARGLEVRNNIEDGTFMAMNGKNEEGTWWKDEGKGEIDNSPSVSEVKSMTSGKTEATDYEVSTLRMAGFEVEDLGLARDPVFSGQHRWVQRDPATGAETAAQDTIMGDGDKSSKTPDDAWKAAIKYAQGVGILQASPEEVEQPAPEPDAAEPEGDLLVTLGLEEGSTGRLERIGFMVEPVLGSPGKFRWMLIDPDGEVIEEQDPPVDSEDAAWDAAHDYAVTAGLI